MRKQIFLVLVLFLFVGNICAQGGWVLRNPFTIDSINYSASLDSSTFIIVGTNNLILKSTDNGSTWISKNHFTADLPGNLTRFLNVNFINNMVGFINSNFLFKSNTAGEKWELVSEDSFDYFFMISEFKGFAIRTENAIQKIYKTINGGSNWLLQGNLPVNSTHYTFINENLAYLTSERSLYKSTNGGQTWTFNFQDYDGLNFVDINFKNENLGFASTYAKLYRTTDGGVTWVRIYSFPSSNYLIRKISFSIDDKVLLRILKVNNSSTSLLLSSDLGVSWDEHIISLSESDISAISFYNLDNILISKKDNKIYRSSDLGNSLINVTSRFNISENLNDLSILSTNEAIISTNSNTLLRTQDKGISWSKESKNIDINGLHFISDSKGYCYSHGFVYKTSDKGSTWISLPSSPSYGSNYWYRDLKFTDENNGALIMEAPDNGPFSGLNSIFYKTTNGGQNWISTTYVYGMHNPGYWTNDAYAALKFINDSTGYMSENYSIIYLPGPTFYKSYIKKTTNSGDNWSNAFYLDGFNLKDFQFINESTGYVCTNGDGMYKTTNAGTNWLKISSYAPDKIQFINESTGYANGQMTTDGGVNWVNKFRPISGCNAIKVSQSGFGLIIGNSGVLYGTIDGGGVISAVFNTNAQIPEAFTLSQNYPNPFNPSTRINYKLRNSSYVSLKVFDLLGKEVATLVNEKQSAGSYEVDFNSTEFNLPSGIYFYTLNAGEFKETKKMVLVK